MGQPLLKGVASGPAWPESKLLAAIVNSSDDAIVGKTIDGMITSWNPAAERMYGYRAEEILGQPMTILCPPDRVGEVKEILDQIARGERVVHHETIRQRKDGATVPMSVTVSAIRDDHGTLVGASSIARDIGEQQQARAAVALRRRAEDLEQANQNLQAFTYSVAHDLRAPLRALNGFSVALVEDCADDLGEAGRGYAGRIQAASAQMVALIDDLLLLARVTQAEMHLQTVDLGAMVAGIAARLQRGSPDRHVRFTIQRRSRPGRTAPSSAPSCRTWSRTPGSSPPGRHDAAIEFAAAPSGDGDVDCYVRDNGAGFDPAYADKLSSIPAAAFGPRVPGQRRWPGQRAADRGAPRGPGVGRGCGRRGSDLPLHS